MVLVGEGLVGAGGAGGELEGVGWEGEGFAVPMEGGEVVWQQVSEGVRVLGGYSLDGEPADFFGLAWGNLCAEDFGDELCAEA